jgi:hypothetical protein
MTRDLDDSWLMIVMPRVIIMASLGVRMNEIIFFQKTLNA